MALRYNVEKTVRLLQAESKLVQIRSVINKMSFGNALNHKRLWEKTCSVLAIKRSIPKVIKLNYWQLKRNVSFPS